MEKSVWMKQKVSLIKIKHVVNKKVQKRCLLKESKEARIFIMQEKQLLIILMNILQEHLKQGVKQKKEQDLKY